MYANCKFYSYDKKGNIIKHRIDLMAVNDPSGHTSFHEK